QWLDGVFLDGAGVRRRRPGDGDIGRRGARLPVVDVLVELEVVRLDPRLRGSVGALLIKVVTRQAGVVEDCDEGAGEQQRRDRQDEHREQHRDAAFVAQASGESMGLRLQVHGRLLAVPPAEAGVSLSTTESVMLAPRFPTLLLLEGSALKLIVTIAVFAASVVERGV